MTETIDTDVRVEVNLVGRDEYARRLTAYADALKTVGSDVLLDTYNYDYARLKLVTAEIHRRLTVDSE